MNAKKNKSVKKLVSLGLAFALLLTLFGCGNASGSSQKVKEIKVALVASNPPFSYLGKNNKAQGYDGELLRIIDKKLKGYKFTYSALAQNSALVGLASGKFDLASSHFYKNSERAKKYLFSGQPTGLSDSRLIIRKNETHIHSLADLHTRKLAPISTDDARYSIIANYNKAHPNNKIDLVGIGDQYAADPFKAIAAGRYDAAIYPLPAFQEVQKQLHLKLKVTPSIGVVPTFFLFNKQIAADKTLRNKVDVILKELKKDGTLVKLSKKWYGENVFTLKK
ncbi:MAG: transporter substrate-binding domain-containing protein [Sporolactobacillus sp.]